VVAGTPTVTALAPQRQKRIQNLLNARRKLPAPAHHQPINQPEIDWLIIIASP